MNTHSRITHPAPHDVPARAIPSGRQVARGAALRGRLLAAAETLVAERQVSAITARDIAERAGVADGALYNHFADKHDLILEALLARFGRLVAVFEEEVGAVRSAEPPLPLETVLTGLTAAAYRLQAATLPMFAHVLSEPALFHRFMAAIHRPPLGGRIFMDPFEEYLATERAGGRVADHVPAAAADMLVGAILLRALVQHLAPSTAATDDAHLADIVRTLVAGLAPRPEPG